METRSKSRAAQTQVPPEGVLEDPGPRSPTDTEDLGLASMMGDGEAPIVGGGQPEVRATTSTLGDVQVATKWAPAREPAAESSRPQPTQVGAESTILTLRNTVEDAAPASINTYACTANGVFDNFSVILHYELIEINRLSVATLVCQL